MQSLRVKSLLGSFRSQSITRLLSRCQPDLQSSTDLAGAEGSSPKQGHSHGCQPQFFTTWNLLCRWLLHCISLVYDQQNTVEVMISHFWVLRIGFKNIVTFVCHSDCMLKGGGIVATTREPAQRRTHVQVCHCLQSRNIKGGPQLKPGSQKGNFSPPIYSQEMGACPPKSLSFWIFKMARCPRVALIQSECPWFSEPGGR
jgi:hypothetical protein